MADIDPQRLLPQGTVGDLHSEDLIQLHDLLRGKPACPEQTARGLHAGEHRHAYVPADKESGKKMRERQEKRGERQENKRRERMCTGRGEEETVITVSGQPAGRGRCSWTAA